MPTSGRSRRDVLVDTSVAVPLVVQDHGQHGVVSDALADCRLGLAGHASFETYSVLTRLPGTARRSAALVGEILRLSFPRSAFLPAEAASALLARLPSLGLAGGSVYDALVGSAARHHGLVLMTRDRRASVTYRALEVEYELID